MILSILVPVYNVAAYLRRCVGSLLQIPLIDYEIILVDDGSQDESGAICDELVGKYPCIRAVHQVNQGLVTARSTGLAMARGKYVSFVDSDDWVDKDLLSDLVQDLESHSMADIAAGRVVRSTAVSSDRPYLNRPSGMMTGDEAFAAMVRKEGVHWYLWGKVYRKCLFQGLRVDPNVTVFEDLDRVGPLMQQCRYFIFDDRHAYHYFVNTTGMTEKRCDLNPASWRVLKRAALACKDKAIKGQLMDFYVQFFLRQTFEMYYTHLPEYKEKIAAYIKELITTIHEVGVKQTVLPDTTYQCISSGENSCIAYYANTVKNIQIMLLKLFAAKVPVYVYGTGIVAQYVADIMAQMQLRVTAFIVSDGQIRQQSFMSRPVLYFSSIDRETECHIILALTGKARGVVHRGIGHASDRMHIHDIDFPPIVF